jgi:uncharacterized protein YkwD
MRRVGIRGNAVNAHPGAVDHTLGGCPREVRMNRLMSIGVGTAVAGLLVCPSGAIGAPSGVPGAVLVAGNSAATGSSAMVPLRSGKPSASVAVNGRILASGKVRLTVTSNAKSVKVSYRTATGKGRTAVRKTKRGTARITLPRGSREIRVRARSTARLASSPWIRVVPSPGAQSSTPNPDRVTVPTPSPVPGTSPSGSTQSPGSAAVTPAPVSSPDPVATAVEVEVGRLVNQARASARTCGTTSYPAVPALAINDLLVRSARAHSQDMAANGYFSHTGLDGSQPWDRMSAAGYAWSAAGENIAAGQPTAQQVMNAWLSSSGHCANIMSSSVTEIGVGHAYSASAPYGHYWTQNFGRSGHE